MEPACAVLDDLDPEEAAEPRRRHVGAAFTGRSELLVRVAEILRYDLAETDGALLYRIACGEVRPPSSRCLSRSMLPGISPAA
jgi:hypothetical protein